MGDHPRTRGVYHQASAAQVAAAGSSPHTRGLQDVEGFRPETLGIIPAHAGFTLRRRW